jgi:hypothetical protein
MPEDSLRTEGLPKEEYPTAVYLGLAVSGVILGIGALVLLREVLLTFTREGLVLSSVLFFRIVLLLLSLFSSLACFFGIFWMVRLQKMVYKKVDEEFRDFLLYARPLVEEVIRQRIIGEKLLAKLERMEMLRLGEAERFSIERKRGGEVLGISRWGEFLFSTALLTGVSVGLFVYLERHPWKLVPYSVLLLAFLWWLHLAHYFGLLLDIRSYYLPSLFILLSPTLSVLLRGFMEPYEALYVVFLLLTLYIGALYLHFKYLAYRQIPLFLLRGPEMLQQFLQRRKEIETGIPWKLQEYLPAPKPLPISEGEEAVPEGRERERGAGKGGVGRALASRLTERLRRRIPSGAEKREKGTGRRGGE